MKNHKIKKLTATEKCEQYLKKEKQYNIEHEIYPSQNIVIERLLSRTLEMTAVYKELVEKFSDQNCKIFINIVLSSAAHWNPEAAKKHRKEKTELQNVNEFIHKKALELSIALSKRDVLHNTSGFYSNTLYCICDVIDKASRNNGHYTGFLQKELDQLCYQYDLKYWPNLSDIIHEIAEDARNPTIEATDLLTKAATDSQRSSKSDFLKALLASIHQNTYRVGIGLPTNTKITDTLLATVVNCALNLGIDEIVDSDYVKGVRQRLREGYEKK